MPNENLQSETAHQNPETPSGDWDLRLVRLLPCPFCGGEPDLNQAVVFSAADLLRLRHWVACLQCGANGKKVDSNDDPRGSRFDEEVKRKIASLAWNDRFLPNV
jgi:hypothetical protein